MIKELRYWLGQAQNICEKRDKCEGCPFRGYRVLQDRRGSGRDKEHYCCLDEAPYEWDLDTMDPDKESDIE